MAALEGRRAHLRPVVQLAIHTTLRRGELLSLLSELRQADEDDALP